MVPNGMLFLSEGERVKFWSHGSLRLGKQGLHSCNPMLRQCNKPSAPKSAKTFCALSKALWARSADLISVYHSPRKHYLPEKNIFELFSDYRFTISLFFFFRINFKNLPNTYCICVSCVTLPGWDPCPCRIIFYYRYPI